MDRYTKWFKDRGLSYDRRGWFHESDATNAGDIAQDLGISINDTDALKWLLDNYRAGDSSARGYRSAYNNWIDENRNTRGQGRDNRGRDDRGRDNRGRDDQGRDNRGGDDQGRDNRGGGRDTAGVYDDYDRPVPGDPSRFFAVSEGPEWTEWGISEHDDDILAEMGFTPREAAQQINYIMDTTGMSADEATDWVVNNSYPGNDLTTQRSRDRIERTNPQARAETLYSESQNLMNEFLNYYREDRQEAKKWRDKLDDERKDALDKALEEEERRRTIEDEARQDFLGYREQTRQQYEDEMAERQRFRDLAEQSYADRADLIQDIRNAPSTVEESARQSFEQTLANQAALSATLPTRTGGSSAKFLADQARTHNAQIAAQTSTNRLVEQNMKNQMLSGLIGQQEASATQQQNFALGGANASLAAQNQAMQEMTAQGAMANRALGAQGLQAGLQTNLGGQYGAGLGQSMQGAQAGAGGYAGMSQNLLAQQFQMQQYREQQDLARLQSWLGLAQGVIGAGGMIAGAAIGGPAGASVGAAAGSQAGAAVGKAAEAASS